MIENKPTEINEQKIRRVIGIFEFSIGSGIALGAGLEKVAPSHQIIPIAMVIAVVNGISLYRSR